MSYEQPNETAELSVAEGVLLGHALVARVAAELGIRAFFIKGPVSVLQGLRQPRTSGDVDVFVAPSDLETLLEGLLDRGWRKRPVNPDFITFPRHSVTLFHHDWPCCIDVHFRFPGIEVTAVDAFEIMWQNTEGVALAGQDVRIPSKVLAIIVLALHALRAPQMPASRGELTFLARLTQEKNLVLPIFELATSIGSLAALRPFLEGLLPGHAASAWPQPSKEWRNRLMTQAPGSARLIAIGQAPLREVPQMLWKALFPSTEVFRSWNMHADTSLPGLLRAHGARWVRFLLAIPRIARDMKGFTDGPLEQDEAIPGALVSENLLRFTYDKRKSHY